MEFLSFLVCAVSLVVRTAANAPCGPEETMRSAGVRGRSLYMSTVPGLMILSS